MRTHVFHFCTGTLIWCLFAIGNTLLAQQATDNHIPHLNGHLFVSNMSSPSAFMNSHFEMNLGLVNSEGFESVIFEIDGEPVTGLKGALFFTDLSFDYKQKIKEWLSFSARIGLTARLGTEVKSLLSQGINTVSSFSLGWNFRLIEKEKWMLSGKMNVNNYTINYISVKELVEDIVLDSTFSGISKKVPILNGGVGLQFAYGLNDLVGFQAHAAALYGDSFERGASDFIYHLGGVVDFNLASTTKVPLGLGIGITASSLPDLVQVKGKSSTTTFLKIGYMGSAHYDVGLEITRVRIPIPDVEKKVDGMGFFITSKYYFN